VNVFGIALAALAAASTLGGGDDGARATTRDPLAPMRGLQSTALHAGTLDAPRMRATGVTTPHTITLAIPGLASDGRLDAHVTSDGGPVAQVGGE